MMDSARKLDLADRYINNKCTKYMLRADDVDNARATAALFTREEAGEPEQHLRDMQASWYELEVGSALARRVTTGTPSELRELAGPALKLFLSVEKHFSDFVEDQFDFHTYCAVWKSNFTARSSRPPPRHRRDACSMAWRCRFLNARPSQDGRVVAEK